MKHIVAFSGGHSSALAAVEVVRLYGKESVVLLNHDISGWVESSDVKRFKKEVADYLGLPVTYANHKGLNVEMLPDQFDVTVAAKAFKVKNGAELCTSRLKTEPFAGYLAVNHPKKDAIIYYGFDANETARIQRRSSILGEMGFASGYPLALWAKRTITSIQELGIKLPNTYGHFKHANCTGCLKAGRQHWYIVYCTRPDIWAKAKWAEEEIGYSIIAGVYLEELESLFEQMRNAGVPQTEHIPQQAFWPMAKKLVKIHIDPEPDQRPCECIF